MAAEFIDAAAERRKQLAAMLLRGEKVAVAQSGEIRPIEERSTNQASIVIPEGKLAARSLYWYENEPEILHEEVEVMSHFFPQFRRELLNDNRMSWVGHVASGIPGSDRIWYLQAVYDHDHPHNQKWGGSVLVIPIEPSLEFLSEQIGTSIPHTFEVEETLAICTAFPEDFQTKFSEKQPSDTAASSIARAVKWIAAFELWMLGEIDDDDFYEHTI
jgi:hypothetical protein